MTLIDAVAALAPHAARRASCSSWARSTPTRWSRRCASSRRAASWPARSACSTRTCSSTTGCRTTSARAIWREADLGVSTHREHLETHFSFRTRMLDYLWARPADRLHRRRRVRATWCDARTRRRRPARRRRGARATRSIGCSTTCAARTAAPGCSGAARRRHAVEPRRHAARAVSRAAAARRRSRRRAWRACGTTSRAAYRVSKWLKRTAFELGVSELRVEQLKRLKAVRDADDRCATVSRSPGPGAEPTERFLHGRTRSYTAARGRAAARSQSSGRERRCTGLPRLRLRRLTGGSDHGK